MILLGHTSELSMIRRVLQSALFTASFIPLLAAQDNPEYKKAPNPGESRVRAVSMMQGRTTFKGADEARNKADLVIMAKALVYPVTDLSYYSAPEVNPKKPTELTPVPPELTIKSRIEDLDKFILKPGKDSKLNFDQHDYLVEFGVALDTVFKEILKADSSPPVRVNAAIMLATAAKSGAPAHAAMITDLIANPDTRPEILIHALKAAEHLLSAYDPRLSGSLNFGDHTIKGTELLKLVVALDKVINRQTPYGQKKEKLIAVPPEPKKDDKGTKKDDKPKSDKDTGKLDSRIAPLDKDDAKLIRYIRRAAIKALAQIRTPTVIDSKTNATARPLALLCRIALNDGPFVPKLGPDEYSEAVIGLCNQHSLRGVDLDALLTCIAIGTKNFAQGRGEYNIAWKGTAARMSLAWADWDKVISTTAAMQGAAAKVSQLSGIILPKVLNPIEISGKNNPGSGATGLESLMAWIAGKKTDAIMPYTDLKEEEKAKYILKPVQTN